VKERKSVKKKIFGQTKVDAIYVQQPGV